MKIFIVGLPKSGRSTISKALVKELRYQYIDAMSWVRSAFRAINKGEHPHQYEDAYQEYLSKAIATSPQFVSDNIFNIINDDAKFHVSNNIYVIDGVSSPRDFATLFDYQNDIVVFLNRTDSNHEYRDHENIGTSVIRDYCFWMSAAGLINKQRWLEYNFKIPGEDSDHVKQMGAQNSVYIVKSIKKVISHLTEKVKEIVDAVL